MGYLPAERVKEIRTQLKKEFPSIKFSVTRSHYSGVNICILQSPYPFEVGERGYKQVNEYHLQSTYTGSQLVFLERILQIATVGQTQHETADYGTQPSFYVYIKIGDWDKKYVCTSEITQTSFAASQAK